MTSIASMGMSGAFASPRDRLLNELQSQISSGEIAASDESALTTALDSIDSTLKSEGAAARQSGSPPPSPSEMKEKIAGLIDDQVSAGTLTSDQAEELKGVFEQAMQGGPGGPPAGGPPPGGPPPSGEADGSNTSSTSSDTDVGQLLADFLKLLQESQPQTSSYGADGEKDSTLTSASLVLNFTA